MGIPPAPRGVPRIEVAFDIDANGILTVSARDLGTGKEQSVHVVPTSGLSEGEIQRIIDDAVVSADKDRERRELAEARNRAEALLYTSERALGEMGHVLVTVRPNPGRSVPDCRSRPQFPDIRRCVASIRGTPIRNSDAPATHEDVWRFGRSQGQATSPYELSLDRFRGRWALARLYRLRSAAGEHGVHRATQRTVSSCAT